MVKKDAAALGLFFVERQAFKYYVIARTNLYIYCFGEKLAKWKPQDRPCINNNHHHLGAGAVLRHAARLKFIYDLVGNFRVYEISTHTKMSPAFIVLLTAVLYTEYLLPRNAYRTLSNAIGSLTCSRASFSPN